MCVCVQRRPLCARHLDSVHLQRQRGQKRHPFLVSGRGAIDTNKSPFYFLPSVLGLCQECPRSIVPRCSVFGNPSPSILCSLQRLLPPPLQPNTHAWAHTHAPTRRHKHTPWAVCPLVPNSEQTTSAEYDRQAGVRTSGSSSHARWLSGEKATGRFHLFTASCETGERSQSKGLSACHSVWSSGVDCMMHGCSYISDLSAQRPSKMYFQIFFFCMQTFLKNYFLNY